MYEGALGKQYADGEVICRQGESGDGMYIIQAGRATVVREDDGTTVFVGELAAGDIRGLDTQLSGLRRSSALDGGNPSVTASGERIGRRHSPRRGSSRGWRLRWRIGRLPAWPWGEGRA